MMRRQWIRVNKHGRCPICDHDSWCMVKVDGSAVLCARVKEGCAKRRDGSAIEAKDGQGWLHELLKDQPQPQGRPRMAPRAVALPEPEINCADLQQEFRWSISSDDVSELAASLGVAPQTLARLGIGWADRIEAYTFPMMDGVKRIIGFRTRHADGQKKAVPGSRSGLFIPRTLTATGPLLICEGPTDTAAALTLGFDAIGRPSCRGGVDHIVRFLRGRRPQPVWILSDRDKPGKEGAAALADALVELGRVVIVMAPPAHKDLRAWVQAGATRTAVECIASQRLAWTRREQAA